MIGPQRAAATVIFSVSLGDVGIGKMVGHWISYYLWKSEEEELNWVRWKPILEFEDFF